ncbi:HIT domain protein [compost metagenome]
MEAVTLVEQALRQHLSPTKINLAALGNMVPHLHWHVIARFDWDSHFPSPVWAAAQRPSPAAQEAGVRTLLPALEAQLQSRLAQLPTR